MTTLNHENARVARVSITTPMPVQWSKQRFELWAFALGFAWIGPVLTIAAAGHMAKTGTGSPWLIVSGLILTAVAVSRLVPSVRRVLHARRSFRHWVGENTPSLSPAERAYFTTHAQASMQQLWGKEPSWFIQGPTDPTSRYDLRLIAQ